MKQRFSLKMAIKVGLFAITAVAIVLILPREANYGYDYQVGKPWTYDDLIAPESFAVMKSDAMLQADKNAVMADQKFYFYKDTSLTTKGSQEIAHALTDVFAAAKMPVSIEKKYIEHAKKIYRTIMEKGVVEDMGEFHETKDPTLIVMTPDNHAYSTLTEELFTKEQAIAAVDSAINMQNNYEVRYLMPVVKANIKTNIIYNKELTEKTLQQQLSDISLTSGVIQKGELIIGKGAIVTDEKMRILDSFQKIYIQTSNSNNSYVGRIVGQTITAILSLLILALYLYLFKKEVFWSNRNIALVLFVITLMLLAASITVRFGDEYIYAVPICLVPVLVTTFFGARTALFAHIALLLNTGFIVFNGFEYMFIQMLAGIITIFSIIKLQKRAQVLKMMVMVFGTYVVATVGFTLIKTGNPHLPNTNMYLYFAISSGLLITSYPLTYVFERIFGIVTNVTLMELSDTNTKLLRELSTKAPGTFQHSNQVANLAEEAAYAIDANPMLTRAGAWYHDIGKIENPSFFIENQMGNENPHQHLSYQESAKIIISHVSKGVEIAKKYHLPPQIIDFIRMHHGNRKTSYFYRMEKKGNPALDASLFTYPGPIPNSKEVALVMMADSVEAASRSMKEPTENSINQMVEKIIDELITEHQFDNANITMRDINTVKKFFTKRLMNIYHVRIAYPEDQKQNTEII